MKKLLGLLAVAPMALSACGGSKATVKEFTAKDSFGDTKSIYVFNGETTDDKITSLDFDVLTPEGDSKKEIDNYLMNVSDFNITENESNADQFDIMMYAGGCANLCTVSTDQFMDYGVMENVKPDTKMSELNWNAYFENPAGTADFNQLSFHNAAKQFGMKLTEDSTVIQWANAIGAIKGNELKEVTKRFSFEGLYGGKSFGEQIDAIETHILENEMTLEEAKEFFEAGQRNDDGTLVVSGATISFVNNYARIVDVAMGNKVEEGIISSGVETTGEEWFNVRTLGYGGDIILKITTNVAGDEIQDIEVIAEEETDSIGGKEITEEKLEALVIAANAGTLGDASEITGSTVTFNAVVKGIKFVLTELA